MLSRDKRLPFEKWNAPGLQESVCLVFNFLHLVRREILFREFIIVRRQERQTVPRAIGTGTSFARDGEQNKGTFPMLTFAGRPSTMSSKMLVEFLQNPAVWQQEKKEQKSELQLDKFPLPHSFWFWKKTFKNQVTPCSDFQSETMLWINEVETVGSLDEQKILAIGCWKGFSKLWDAGREDCSCCE